MENNQTVVAVTNEKGGTAKTTTAVSLSAALGERGKKVLLVDLDGQEVKRVNAVANPNYGRHAPGTVPTFIQNQGADVMLAGGMGRRAIALFQQYGIQAATGAAGSVRHALECYLDGALQGAEPCLTSRGHGHEEIPAEEEYERDAA